MNISNIDKLLTEKFPNNMYNHNVNEYLPGNETGYLELCVDYLDDTESITNYIKELGADELYIEHRNTYNLIIFHMLGDKKKFDYKTEQWLN